MPVPSLSAKVTGTCTIDKSTRITGAADRIHRTQNRRDPSASAAMYDLFFFSAV